MKPNEIKSALILKNITCDSIAKKANVSRQMVYAVIRKDKRSARVEKIIADDIGRPVSQVFKQGADE